MVGGQPGCGNARRAQVDPVEDPLKSYLALVEKVDAFFERVADKYGDRIKCGPGCDDCCRRSLSLYPFEIDRMVAAAGELDPAELEGVIRRSRRAIEDPEAACPLLSEGRCLIYAHRPIICRTHGLPMLVPGEDSLSMCVYNLKGLERLDGDCVLDLKPVNQILATVNHLLTTGRGTSPERLTVADAILARFNKGDE
jgi:Fe-S-cluster containining protein